MKNSKFFSHMLSQTQKMRVWWDIRKVGFKRRIAVLSLVVVSTTLYVVFLHPLMKFLWLLVFFVSAELFTFIYTPVYLGNLWLRLTFKKKTIPIDIPIQITNLINQVGVKIDELRIQPNLRNAYVVGKTIVLGWPLIEELKTDEVLAIVAHELGHIKEKPFIIRFLISLGCLLSIGSWLTLPLQILAISSLAYFMIVMIPFNWIIEYRAYQVATKFVGSDNLRSALLKIMDKKNLNEPSEDHPSISNRLKLIGSKP